MNDDLAVLTPAPTGENTKQVQTEYDGLGRVSKVCHIGSTTSTGSGTACSQKTGSANGATDAYSYTSASGTSTVSVTRGSQTRSKTFDALGRVIQKVTPEGGTWNYYYDSHSTCPTSNGNLVCTTDPNEGLATAYNYDSLNRLTSIIKSTSGDTCRHFYYDNSTGYSGTIPTGITISNGLGRIVEAATDDCSGTHLLTDEWFSYDKDGRVSDQWQSTPHSTQYYHSVATFFENGEVETLQLASPSLYTMTYGLEGEGRWNTLTDTTASTNIVTGTTFYPAHNPAVVSYTGTTPDNDAYTFDANTGRLTKFVFTVGNTPANLTGNLYWNANGTLGEVSTTDGFNAGNSYNCYSNATGSLGHGYDDWVRLNEFDCGSGNWGQQYAYDIYDNLTKTVLSGRTGTTWNPGYSSSNNHCTGCTYDSNGDVLTDGNDVYTWNEFAKLESVTTSGTVTCGTNGQCPVYDAFGRVVETSSGSTWTEWWITQLGTESMSGITGNFGSFPAPGGNTAIVSSSIYVLHEDWLGSARIGHVVTTHTVSVDRGFTPYGETYSNYGSGSTQAQLDLFAGMTDNFDRGVMYDTPNRELSIVGRWLSPDPAGAGWNQYAYSTNPNSFVDPSGLYSCIVGSNSSQGCGSDNGYDESLSEKPAGYGDPLDYRTWLNRNGCKCITVAQDDYYFWEEPPAPHRYAGSYPFPVNNDGQHQTQSEDGKRGDELMDNRQVEIQSYNLFKKSGYGNEPTERSMWVTSNNGQYGFVPWDWSAEYAKETWHGPAPKGAVAVVHTHPSSKSARPSRDDHDLADGKKAKSIRMPVYDLHWTGIWKAEPGVSNPIQVRDYHWVNDFKP